MVKRKYTMVGLNTKSGSVMQIEFSDPKIFSSEMVRDQILYPKDEPRLILELVKKNKGTEEYLNKLCREFYIGVNEIDEQLFGRIDAKVLRKSKVFR